MINNERLTTAEQIELEAYMEDLRNDDPDMSETMLIHLHTEYTRWLLKRRNL